MMTPPYMPLQYLTTILRVFCLVVVGFFFFFFFFFVLFFCLFCFCLIGNEVILRFHYAGASFHFEL